MMRLWCGLGLLCLALANLVGCGGNVTASSADATYAPRLQRVDVTVADVRRQPLSTEIEFTGNLLPRRVTRVMAEVDGVVRDIPQVGTQINVVVDGKRYSERLGMTYGQLVKEGDVLVQLDTRDAEVALQMAEAKLSKARADLAKLRSWERPEQVRRLTALRDESKARYNRALSDHRRIEGLVQRGASTRSELERTAMETLTTKAAWDAAEATLVQATAGPTQEEIAVQQALIAQAEAEVEQQKRELEKATIRAPYDGVITAFEVEVGDRVSPSGNPVVELMDLRYLAAEIAVPEAYIGQVAVQDRAQVTAAGSADPVPGLVVAVNDMVDPRTRTFHVRVAIDNAHRRFKAGQFATVGLAIGADETERLAVPNAAVVFVEGEPHVFTVSDDRATTTPVELGISNDRLTEILAGVDTGDVVVVDDPSLLADGMEVTVRNSTTPRRTASHTSR